MTVRTLMANMTSVEISEWMAFDNLKNKDYVDRLKSESMSMQERDNKLKQLLSFK